MTPLVSNFPRVILLFQKSENLLCKASFIFLPTVSGLCLAETLSIDSKDFILDTLVYQQSIFLEDMSFISFNAMPTSDNFDIMLLRCHSYFSAWVIARNMIGYLPNSPNTARREAFLCTESSNLHAFWFKTSGLKVSQAEIRESRLWKHFFGKIRGDHSSHAYRATGDTIVSNMPSALSTGHFLCE